jgi:hypothetical protein
MEQRISNLTVYDLTERELLIYREELDDRCKSPLVTWLLWCFLGGIGGHRYYLGNIVRAIFMTLTLGGLGFWALIDAFFIPGSLRMNRHEVSQRILLDISAMRRGGEPAS